MREIKFRAWDKNKKKMHNVIQIIWGSELNPYPLSVDFYDSTKPRLFEKVELMQFTGLKDKNGKEIYEGDIVGGWQKIRTVVYRNGGFKLKSIKSHHAIDIRKWHQIQLEVIGNIYENSNLLK
jgi:uncharacterized phage protein (TIGR01671 family)